MKEFVRKCMGLGTVAVRMETENDNGFNSRTLVRSYGGYVAESITPYWTWKRLGMFVLIMRNGRTPTRGEWQALLREIPSLSVTKRIWLYRQLKPYFSPEAMKYLFSGWRPPSSPMDLGPWL
jgi:hypothetical protein